MLLCDVFSLRIEDGVPKSLEGDNIDGGDEARGDSPNNLSGVHGETE